MRIVVSGGGTAGHISPILATVDALKAHKPSDLHILYIGQKGSMEERIAGASHISFAGITAGKWRRNTNMSALRNLIDLKNTGLNIRDSGRVVAGVTQALKVLRQFGPDLVFIKGGFVGLPVGIAARLLRIPYVIHESDLTPGATNKILAKHAQKIAVGFPVDKYPMWPLDKLVFTGSPIRKEVTKYHRLEGITHFKLQQDLPVILVTGGSQGARAINNLVVQALPHLLESYQVIHITGEGEFGRVTDQVGELSLTHPERYVVRPFLLEDMGLAYAASDLAIARAGANTIADLAALARPAILIPNNAMAAHQLHNARVLARAGAVKVLYEDKTSSAQLIQQIDQILGSESEQQQLAKHIQQFGVADGAERLAGLLVEVAS